MALFNAVARANPVVEERHAWIEPFLSAHGFDGFIARGLMAEHALWQGDTEEALTQTRAALDVVYEPPWGFYPSAIRPAAVAMCALADRAVQARATGDEVAAAAAVTAAGELLQIAREGAAFPKRPRFIREREVLRLIAAGRSNREIASVLFIAPKTASVHVSNILGKLGAASRTEAAAIAHREGLLPQPAQPSGR